MIGDRLPACIVWCAIEQIEQSCRACERKYRRGRMLTSMNPELL